MAVTVAATSFTKAYRQYEFGNGGRHTPPKSSDEAAWRRPMSMEFDGLLRSVPLFRRLRFLSKECLGSEVVAVQACSGVVPLIPLATVERPHHGQSRHCTLTLNNASSDRHTSACVSCPGCVGLYTWSGSI